MLRSDHVLTLIIEEPIFNQGLDLHLQSSRKNGIPSMAYIQAPTESLAI